MVDIYTTVDLKQKILAEDQNFGFDRRGTGYQVKHTFTQEYVNQATTYDDMLKSPQEASLFIPKFKLTTELTFLFVDKAPTDLQNYDNLQRKYATTEVNLSSDATTFDNMDVCGSGYGSVDLSGLPVAEPGTPGNESILASAKTLIEHGFKYVWGGLKANGMDCSAFTMYAVKNSGADAGRRTGYPRSTSTQIKWLSDEKNGAIEVDFVNIKPGDIVFFKTERCDWCHTAIAIDKHSYYHSNSVHKKGADIGSFDRRRPKYIFRLLPLNSNQQNAIIKKP
jgi:cell wall-associated NlpC family hydrolase